MTNAFQSSVDEHTCFRILLQAMSRPGQIFRLPNSADDPLQETVLRLLGTILDPMSSCCLIEVDAAMQQAVSSRTGTVFTDAANADFLLALTGSSHGKIFVAKRGRPDFPEEGASILFGVERLATKTAGSGLSLSGPGIKAKLYPIIEGLDPQDLDALRQVNAEFPLGVDCILVDRTGQFLCIPRSTRIGGK